MLKEPSELRFETKNHLYTINGIKIPSVTQIIEMISNLVYVGVDEYAKIKAGWKGIDVHFAIELYNKTGVLEIEDDKKGYLDAYIKFREKYKDRIKILSSEFKTYHKTLKYGGTIDMVAIFDGERIVIDTKTTSELIKPLVEMQLPAYREAVNSWIKIEKNKIKGQYALHLRSDGEYTFEKVEDRFDMFLKCYALLGFVKKYLKKK